MEGRFLLSVLMLCLAVGVGARDREEPPLPEVSALRLGPGAAAGGGGGGGAAIEAVVEDDEAEESEATSDAKPR